jgi:hypothetical protein
MKRCPPSSRSSREAGSWARAGDGSEHQGENYDGGSMDDAPDLLLPARASDSRTAFSGLGLLSAGSAVKLIYSRDHEAHRTRAGCAREAHRSMSKWTVHVRRSALPAFVLQLTSLSDLGDNYARHHLARGASHVLAPSPHPAVSRPRRSPAPGHRCGARTLPHRVHLGRGLERLRRRQSDPRT